MSKEGLFGKIKGAASRIDKFLQGPEPLKVLEVDYDTVRIFVPSNKKELTFTMAFGRKENPETQEKLLEQFLQSPRTLRDFHRLKGEMVIVDSGSSLGGKPTNIEQQDIKAEFVTTDRMARALGISELELLAARSGAAQAICAHLSQAKSE